MKAKTFFALLNEAHKLDIYEKRFALNIADYPQLDEDQRETMQQSLSLPDDFLEDILINENANDIEKLKEDFG